MKSGRGSKAAASEEVAKSAHCESGGARLSAEVNQSEASVVRPDVDLMMGAIPVDAVPSLPSQPAVHPMPCVLSDDSSESSVAEEVAVASTSVSEEIPTEVDG